MQLTGSQIRLSASNLSNHLGCRHLTWLDLQVANGSREAPQRHDPRLDALIERGFAHEKAYLEHLEAQGRDVHRLAKPDNVTTGAQQTQKAMRAGVDVIVQATLTSTRWLGYADVLLRTEEPSNLGTWSYEVTDTKLARETRAGTILQLSLYSDIVGELQGRAPEYMHVVSPGRDFEPETHRVDDYAAYYRHVRRRLEEAVAERPDEGTEPCYPEPVAQCDICRWWAACRDRRREDDHLSLVAGISKSQIRELEERGSATVAALAEVPVPLEWKPDRGTRAGLEHVREQARVQVEGRVANAPVHELLDLEPDRGFARLPEPSEGDIFFDIEGGRFVGEHGLEYLLAFVHHDTADEPSYEHRWAFNAKAEREVFEWFVDTVMERWGRDPGMHIYHYAPYEPAALKRLMGRYATREDEVDGMLRGGLFVDLYHVVRQAVRASVESYSLKELEPFYRRGSGKPGESGGIENLSGPAGSGGPGASEETKGFERVVDLREATLALRRVEDALELGDDIDPKDPDFATVLGYNKDDCVSTLRLRDWLEQLRADRVAAGDEIPRPALGEPAPSDTIDERQQRIDALKTRLLENVPDDPAERDEQGRARALLADMLDFHRRESKAPWWEYFRLIGLTDLEILDEKAALAGLEFVERVGGTDRCPIHRYRYPQQDMDIRRRDELKLVTEEDLGRVEAVDRVHRTIDVKKKGVMKEVHPTAFFSHSVVNASELAESLYRFGQRVAKHGFDEIDAHTSGAERDPDKAEAHMSAGEHDLAIADAHTAAAELLLRRLPRLAGDDPAQLDSEDAFETACRAVTQLDRSYLPIQGPPGAGKTYTGAHMIAKLVRDGMKVGITAVSHKVIRNLIEKVVEMAGDDARCGQKVKRRSKEHPDALDVAEYVNNQDPLAALTDGEINVLGGTAWLWSREDFEQSVDVLFVDEAGQMALANVLAVAPAARSLVLLGDPQQLEQPQQGSHPEGSDASALEHILGEHKTMPSGRGLFLPETWRLHPSICAFTSKVFYESRLESRPELARQAVDTEVIDSPGLWLLPVEHSGNQSSSIEEADAVAQLVADLLEGAPTWVDGKGDTRPLHLEDIVIVAPYNAQVTAISERMPNARVGTVDKFQGQQAPIVIYSTATSSPEDAPRGMEFLYNPNRLNVATSRARCACILVASPSLFAAECKSPAQMKLANGFCRYMEMAAERMLGTLAMKDLAASA